MNKDGFHTYGTAIGYTYSTRVDIKGGMVVHDPVWSTVKAFKQMNPKRKPRKVIITIEDEL